MISAISLAELLARGVELQPHEAVAIALELIHADPLQFDDTPPLRAPGVDSVMIGSDGRVFCVGCAVTPAVSEVARLLDAMLRRQARMRMPGGLRYAVARALLEVDAPPFDSLAEFGRALARHLYLPRAAVIQAVLARADASVRAPLRPTGIVERRRARTPSAELRRYLREVDKALYEDRLAAVVAPAVIVAPTVMPTATLVTAMPPADPPARFSVRHALAACLIAGVAGAGAWRIAHDADRRASAGAGPAPSTAVLTRPSPASRETVTRGPAADPRSVSRRRAGRPEGLRTNGVSANLTPIAASGSAFSPAFASSGTALFFHTGRSGDAPSALMSAGGLGDDLRVMSIVNDGATNYHAQPSPDGEQIAFDSDRDGERGVYVARRDGTQVRRVSGIGYAAVPTWAPDGTRLAFVRAEPQRPQVWNLWLLSLGSGAMRRLTDFRYGQTWGASWFSDGRRVVYTHEDRLSVLDVETGRSRDYVTPIPGRAVRTPAVSPDGLHVIFQVARHGAWLLDLADGSMRCVLLDPTAEEFAWSPDGRRVAFHSRRDGAWHIWIMAA